MGGSSGATAAFSQLQESKLQTLHRQHLSQPRLPLNSPGGLSRPFANMNGSAERKQRAREVHNAILARSQ